MEEPCSHGFTTERKRGAKKKKIVKERLSGTIKKNRRQQKVLKCNHSNGTLRGREDEKKSPEELMEKENNVLLARGEGGSSPLGKQSTPPSWLWG